MRRLVREADVVVENFSPRVVEQFGLDYESLVELKPDVILVRMPGFGLEGPWRDYVGWALNFEQTSGMSAATGYADGPPCNLQGPADPIVGVHAGVALLAALEHRRRTGEGQLIEVAQIEVAASVAAEPVIEYSMNGVVRPREGNRRRGYLQGVYPTAVDDEWVAHLRARRRRLGATRLEAMSRHRLASSGLAHDAFDAVVADWTQDPIRRRVSRYPRLHTRSGRAGRSRRIGCTTSPQLDARGLLRRARAPDHRAAPLPGLAVPDHARARPTTTGPRRRRSASTTRRSCGDSA